MGFLGASIETFQTAHLILNSLGFSDNISTLGVTLGSDLYCNDQITSAGGCKLDLLFRSWLNFMPNLTLLYKAQIHSVTNIASLILRLWMQFRIDHFKLKGDLSHSLDSPAHLKIGSTLSCILDTTIVFALTS